MHYNTLDELITQNEVPIFLEENNVQSLFTSIPVSQKQAQILHEKYNITTYQLPSIEDDTSRWGYIRFAGKIMNDFVAAFDTYD
jgi:hypothetical protein